MVLIALLKNEGFELRACTDSINDIVDIDLCLFTLFYELKAVFLVFLIFVFEQADDYMFCMHCHFNLFRSRMQYNIHFNEFDSCSFILLFT